MTENRQETPNLYQRLATVTGALEPIQEGGVNQYKKPALSIDDVEEALRAPLAEAGIVTRWSFDPIGGLTDLGQGKLWMACVQVTVTNADNPTETFTDNWMDIGTNPSAAVSFAVKGYYRRLFHLVGEEEEKGTQQASARNWNDREAHTPAGSQRPVEPRNPPAQTSGVPVTPQQSGPNGQGPPLRTQRPQVERMRALAKEQGLVVGQDFAVPPTAEESDEIIGQLERGEILPVAVS